jgi:hypothetical protein
MFLDTEAKAHALCLRQAVILAQVAVGFHAKRAAVFVPKPTRHSRNVYATFDADGNPTGSPLPKANSS